MAEKEAVWEGEMFRLLAENVLDYALFVVDSERRVLSWSKGAERLLGFSADEVLGRSSDCIFTPEDVESGMPQRELDEALATGRGDNDRWHVRKDGSRFWSSGSVTPLRDEGGTLRGFAKIMRDRTDMKRAEDLARERGRQLQLVTDNAPVLIAHVGADLRYKFVNRPFAERFNLHPRDVVGKTIPEVLGEAVFGRIRHHVEAALAGRRVEFEAEVPYDDLGTQTMRVAYAPEFDASGRPVGFVAAILNVSDRKRAEEALRASDERLRTLSDNLPLGAVYQVVGDPTGRRQFLYISAGVERLFGVTPAEVLADPAALYGLVHQDDRARVQAAEEAAGRALAPFDCELRSWTRSGDLIWIHARSAPRRLPTGETAWEGIILDVTDRKRAEEALNRERELLGTIFEKIPVMLTLYEPDTRVLRLNPAFERTTGWSAPDAAGTSLMERCYPDPAYRQRVQEFMQSCRDGWMDIRMRTRDGRDLDTSWANVRLSDGTQVGIGLDITDRKRYEESLKDADRRKDEFLATLAHELRNPLAPIRNGLQVMKLAGGNAAAVEQARGMMERQLAQMVRLIDDLLDVSRITRGKLQLRRERVELASVVRSAVEGSRPLLEASAHHLSVSLPADSVYLDADPARLAQVLGNLLTNAAKYTDRGGHIWLTAERRDGEVVVAVKDTGIGIDAEHLPRVFEMFSQAAPARERSQGGLGIGLSLVKGLVEMHGGTVGAHSEGPGKGSTFTVRLPVRGAAPGRVQPQPSGGERAAARPRRVLVADDNRDAADSLAVMLGLAGHEVHTAYDGQEAVEAAGWFRPDVALLDIGMPKLNGLEAARRIREQPWGRGMVLVAVTGWGQDEDKRRAAEAGFDHHLTKPVDPAALERLLAGLVMRS